MTAGPQNSSNTGPADSGGFETVRANELINRVVQGDHAALADLFSLYRPRLWRLVAFRLHPQLQGRIDADDVLQDAWLRAIDRIESFLRDAATSPFLWFRTIVSQTLVDLHRFHMGAQKRSAAREFSINRGWSNESTSSSMSFHLQQPTKSPSSTLGRAEQARQLESALQGMNENDREVLALRHFEELSNSETARVLNMTEQAASARYIRALARLKQVLEVFPGGFEGAFSLQAPARGRSEPSPGQALGP
ncbi:MAG TPA: sigma-70 family RNA polymerase sigma factor [Schlesneria sp.]|jgi:RNA polymerase sigma-70 factor (ECF subfamily)